MGEETIVVNVQVDGVSLPLSIPRSMVDLVMQSVDRLNAQIASNKKSLPEYAVDRDVLALRVTALRLMIERLGFEEGLRNDREQVQRVRSLTDRLSTWRLESGYILDEDAGESSSES